MSGRSQKSAKSRNSALSQAKSSAQSVSVTKSAKIEEKSKLVTKSKPSKSAGSSKKSNVSSKKTPGKGSGSYKQPKIIGWEIFRLSITPFFCRTRYQKALHRMIAKANYKLHRELDIGHLLKNIRDSKSLVMSFATS